MHARMPVLVLRSELRFNARFDTGRLEIVSCYGPAPPQALYLAGCNQITCVFTWVIDPYLMLCLTSVNYGGSPDHQYLFIS